MVCPVQGDQPVVDQLAEVFDGKSEDLQDECRRVPENPAQFGVRGIPT